jgi:cytoskeleton protein RodZ
MALDLLYVGQFLKDRREEKGLSVDDVSGVLYIRKSLIEAMEAGRWDLLPHKVYVKSYLKDYAQYLKVYDQIATSLKEEQIERVVEVPVQQKSESLYSKLSSKRLSKAPYIYATIVVAILGSFLLEGTQTKESPVPTTRVETTQRVATAPRVADESVAVVPVVPDSKKLMITCEERTWISAVIDNQEKKEFMLNAQEMIILNAKEEFDLLIGNAGGVKLLLNGKDMQFTGNSGEVKRITLS